MSHSGGTRSERGPTSGTALMKTRPWTKAGAIERAGRP